MPLKTMFTMEVGTKLALALSLKEEQINTRGVVTTKYPQVGNGIDFIDIAPQDRLKLGEFISEAGVLKQWNQKLGKSI